MAHFAELDQNNKVLRVIVVNNEVLKDISGNEIEQLGIDFCKNLFGGNWAQTSYSGSFRKNYAGIGYYYDKDLDAFVPPRPYPSWTLNNLTANWEPPVPHPNDNKLYLWDELTKTWVEQ